MELTIVDEIVIESYGEFEEHKNLINNRIKEINPKYYTIDTDIIRTVLRTTILILEELWYGCDG